MRRFTDIAIKIHQQTRQRWSNRPSGTIVLRDIEKIEQPKTRRYTCIDLNIARIAIFLLLCFPGLSLSYVFRLPTKTFPPKLVDNEVYQERILWNSDVGRKSTKTRSTTNHKKMNRITLNAMPLSSLSVANDISLMFFLLAAEESDLTTTSTSAIVTEGLLSASSILVLTAIAASVYEATRSNLQKKEIAIEVDKVEEDLSMKRSKITSLEQKSNVSKNLRQNRNIFASVEVVRLSISLFQRKIFLDFSQS